MADHPLGITRRGFLLGGVAGLGVGASLAWLAARRFPLLSPTVSTTPEDSTQRSGRATAEIMPGRYPGRVIEVRHPNAVSADNVIHAPTVDTLVDHGMAELTGYDPGDVGNAWRSFFDKEDVVGIKVNPVGRKALPDERGRHPRAVGSISSPALVVKIVRCLRAIGVPAKNIILFERYANEFCDAGYKDLVERELPPGVRWLTAAAGYSAHQLDIRGFDPDCAALSADVEKHVVGYDPDVFTLMGFSAREHSPRDDRRLRSHLSLVVSRCISKMITLPVLKDHRSAGVTLALKNMSHGMNNNVARSHLTGIVHGFGGGSSSAQGSPSQVLNPNQCNTFIPQAVSHLRLREKATLHILDGLIGVYEGGPGCWNRTWGTWRHKGLFFATDPVALDHVGWDILDTRRALEGWPPVERMGWLYQEPPVQPTSGAAALAADHALAAVLMQAAAANRIEGRFSEVLNVRQPDHVVLAGELGLGVFPRDRITYRRLDLPA